jgi:hypothetical protein
MGFLALFLVSLSWFLYQHQVPASSTTQPEPAYKLRPVGYIAVDSWEEGPLLGSVAEIPRTKTAQLRPWAARQEKSQLAPPVQESTWQLAARIVRSLILDEVESFVRRAQMVAEVGKHASRR